MDHILIEKQKDCQTYLVQIGDQIGGVSFLATEYQLKLLQEKLKKMFPYEK